MASFEQNQIYEDIMSGINHMKSLKIEWFDKIISTFTHIEDERTKYAFFGDISEWFHIAEEDRQKFFDFLTYLVQTYGKSVKFENISKEHKEVILSTPFLYHC